MQQRYVEMSDNNCNGNRDENIGIIWYADADADGYGDANVTISECTQPEWLCS
jgi:hypothetical protein